MKNPRIWLLFEVGIKIALRNMKDSQNVGPVNEVTRGSVVGMKKNKRGRQ
jgi:hypothetical protein